MPEFNFIETYKLLQPAADRGLVDARNQVCVPKTPSELMT
jgi:hypothetical protein